MTKHIILGATGHVGSATARVLLDHGGQVVAIVHDEAKGDDLRRLGAEIAAVDLHDGDALRNVLRTGRRAFLLNPPAAPDSDTDAEEERTVAAILAALEGSGLEKVVVESTYGAAPGHDIGDSSVLYHLEEGIAAQPIPAAINRAAYYFSNWDMMLDSARRTGVITTPYPADFLLPMVAPADLGRAAARRLMSDVNDVGIEHVEGPARYTPQDVADTLGAMLEKAVRVETVPRPAIQRMFRDLGFSDAGAQAYTRMTKATLDHPSLPDEPTRGTITLWDYLSNLISRSDPPPR